MSFVQASSFLIQPQGGRLNFYETFLGGHCIFSCQQLLILEQGQSCNTSLTLTDVYSYFEACSGKNVDFLCSSIPNEKTTFSGLWVSACQTGFRIFRVPYFKENLNLKCWFRVLGFVGFGDFFANPK